MLVQRQVIFNPLEPAVMSIRAPEDQPVTLLVTVQTAEGVAVATNLDAKLVLIARSSGVPTVYLPENVDVTHGVVRFDIPDSSLKDRNGYSIQFYGTLPGATLTPDTTAPYRWLLAMGVLRLLAGEE